MVYTFNQKALLFRYKKGGILNEDLVLQLSERESLYHFICTLLTAKIHPRGKRFLWIGLNMEKFFESKMAIRLSVVVSAAFELRIGDQLFQMGGIGDVMTYPEYGGHGYATTLLKTALAT